ncbi:MAG: sporulation peptidase YabG, partial [Clostridiales bacterium]|nr:sporulation peptidase YabG [Clostridiales bacterium]
MKVGDIVARKSYNKDIVFKITDIIVDENGKKIAILKGVAFRIIADAELSDLEILKPPDIREILMDKNVESILYRSLKKAKDRDIRNMRGLPKSA